MSEQADTSQALLAELRQLDPVGARDRLAELEDDRIAQILVALGPGHAMPILERFDAERRVHIAAETAAGQGEEWLKAGSYPDNSVGRLVERAPAVFRPGTIVRDAIRVLRHAVKRQLITYVFVTEADGELVGVVTFRELLFANSDAPLSEVMVRQPFYLRPELPLAEAMNEVVTRHFPAYPVCDANGRLVGMVRGQVLFEQQAFEISAQAGSMVGVEKEERLATPWRRSIAFRHPWLQLNLLTAFVAAAVVGVFQDTIDRIVLLAVFLPVLSGQCSNTGCQALAVTLRGMTLGELKPERGPSLVVKEAWLGLVNGALVGVVAAIGMFLLARFESHPEAPMLGLITFLSMVGSCVISGAAGAAVPQLLRRLGTDPATASSIFLTTATDVVSMGLFLGLAQALLS
ncbi:MAG: magnesium transporter [Lysobacterales bacterium]